MARIDSNTRWALRTIPSVTVSSTIVRLGDIVQPLDQKIPLWQRLQTAPIAMFPVNSTTMTIDRDRLDRVIRKAEATPRSIDWLGPREIKVVYDPESGRTSDGRKATTQSSIAQVAYQQDSTFSPSAETPQRSTINAADAQRIVHWIELAIKRELPEIADFFGVEIDSGQVGLDRLLPISGVTTVQPIDRISSGTCRLRIVGRSVDGPIESTIAIQLTGYPKVVVPRTSLARGHRISESDLDVIAISAEKLETNLIVDASQIIGMEVRKTLRAQQPIPASDIGSPVLIHRGDLIEVRVMSGGVTVTTNAKSLGDGSESDLVEIETMRPKKRVVARVVRTGLVEIVTRAPAMRYRELSTE